MNAGSMYMRCPTEQCPLFVLCSSPLLCHRPRHAYSDWVDTYSGAEYLVSNKEGGGQALGLPPQGGGGGV